MGAVIKAVWNNEKKKKTTTGQTQLLRVLTLSASYQLWDINFSDPQLPI